MIIYVPCFFWKNILQTRPPWTPRLLLSIQAGLRACGFSHPLPVKNQVLVALTSAFQCHQITKTRYSRFRKNLHSFIHHHQSSLHQSCQSLISHDVISSSTFVVRLHSRREQDRLINDDEIIKYEKQNTRKVLFFNLCNTVSYLPHACKWREQKT